MAELVGGAILSAVIDMLVSRLASPEILNFFRNNQSVSNLLEKLEITLWSANVLLNDAEDKQVKDPNVKNWVDKLNEVLNGADKVLDEINTEALRRKIEGKVFLKKLVPTSFSTFDKKMKPKIEEIVARLDLLLDQKDRLDLKGGVQSKRLERSPALLIGDPSDVYGRDGDKEAIVRLLMSENSGGIDNVSVIPIVGMGGIGKTTLARLVYDDVRVKNHFEHRAWVTVSDDFDVFRIAKLVFEGLSGNGSEVKELGKLREELEKFLGGKKFFLVLDDVWNENYTLWSSLKSYFQGGSKESKIIVTTRNEEIGSIMGSVPSHPLAPMADDDCWELFRKHAFRSVEASTYYDVEKIGIKIAKKCKGLPLAVMSLAGLLCSVSDPKEWEKILNSDVWELHEKCKDVILPSLWLSYSYLPSNLKRCFGYCSIFPKDYEYKSGEIILSWMAEGLLQRSENMEDVGEGYIKTLVSRSLLQRSAKDESTFVMHDLVHDLATFVSGKDICMRLSEGDGFESFSRKTRHLLCYRGLYDLKGISRANCLCTFQMMSIGYIHISDRVVQAVPNKFRCLRMLCLSKSYIEKVPDSISKLKHLRYLNLSATRIERLPDSICTLYNLQTLLLHNCWNLNRLPANMDNLVSLRHLDISKTVSLEKIPQEVYNDLKALRMVTKFILGSGCRINEVRKFPYSLGRLEIHGLENILDVKDVSEADFMEKSLVTKLTLHWLSENNDPAKDKAILDAMRPHPNLKKIDISGYGGEEFPNWVADHSFSNITEVSLSCCLQCRELPPFGQLPSLEKLEISIFHRVKEIASEFYGSSGSVVVPFNSLKILKISLMDEVQSWSFEDGAFPCLKELSIWSCPMLKSISPHCLPSLEKLWIKNCPQMEALLPTDREMNSAFPSLVHLWRV